jgi:Mrp family chromosome partitioning ATPase
MAFLAPLGVTTGYAFLAPATFHAAGKVHIETAPSAARKPPAELAERLRLLLAASEPLVKAGMVEVTSDDGETFDIRTSGPHRANALESCSAALRVAVREAGKSFDPHIERRAALETALERATRDLENFLAAHLEFQNAPQSSDPASSAKPTQSLDSLMSERVLIQKKLEQSGTSNPYAEPVDEPKLRARLLEISRAISQTRARSAQLKAPPGVQPQVQKEWERLIATFNAEQHALSTPERLPPPIVEIRAPAEASVWPTKPNRPRLLAIGAVLSLLSSAVAFALTGRRSAGSVRPGTVPANPAPRPISSAPPPAGYSSSAPPPAGYSSSAPPPAGYGSSGPPPAAYSSSRPPAAAYSSSQPPASSGAVKMSATLSLGSPIVPVLSATMQNRHSNRYTTPVQAERVGASWYPDLALLPEQRRPLVAALAPLGAERCCVTVVVSSPQAVEDKARLAAEIALGLSELNQARVLLLEGNFTRPHVHRLARINVAAGHGLSEQLEGRRGSPPGARWAVTECSPSFHVLAESSSRRFGSLPPREFEACVSELRGAYDFIVLDGPTWDDVPAFEVVRKVADSAAVLMPRQPAHDEVAQASAFFHGQLTPLMPAVG